MSQLPPTQCPQPEAATGKLRPKAVDTAARMSPYERWTLGISVASLIVSILGFLFVLRSVNGANESLKTTIYGTISNWTFEINKAFVEHPELRPYFYDGKDIDPSDPLYPRAEQMAEYLLDTFDSVLEHEEYFPGPKGMPHPGWLNWIDDCFEQSPILRKYIETHSRWYDASPIWPVYQRWKAGKPAGA